MIYKTIEHLLPSSYFDFIFRNFYLYESQSIIYYVKHPSEIMWCMFRWNDRVYFFECTNFATRAHSGGVVLEHMNSAQFLQPRGGDLVMPMTTRQVPHSSLLAGTRLILSNAASSKGRRTVSGYQALRLATELLPATFAAMGLGRISVFWSILAYFSLILFGIAQQVTVALPCHSHGI